MTRPAVAALRAEWEAGKLAGGHMSERTVQFVERLLAALEVPPTLTDAQAWELWEQLGGCDTSGFANKRELADWVRAVVGRSVRGETPPSDTIKREVLAAYLDKPEDRLYHAEDSSWWRRDDVRGVGTLVRADAPIPKNGPCPKCGGLDGTHVLRSCGEAPPEPCPHIRTSPEGTSYCTLAERGGVPAPPPEPAASEVRQLASDLRRLAHIEQNLASGHNQPDMWGASLTRAAELLEQGRAVSVPQEGPPGVAAYEGLLRAVDRGASAPPAGPDWKAAALACVVPMEALHADNLAGSQLIAPSLRVAIAEAVEALRKAVAGGASAPVPMEPPDA